MTDDSHVSGSGPVSRPVRWKRRLVLAALLLLTVSATALIAGYVYLTHRVEGSYFETNGVRIHYTDEGAGQPVVLIHGFAVNADLNWRRPGITPALSERYRVIAVDLRGHGLSDKPHDVNRYGVEMVEDVIGLLDHLQIERAHVVGYSLGGCVALKLAAAHPDRLVTVAPLGVGWERPDNSDFLGALDEFADALERGEAIGPLAGRLGGNRPAPGLLHTAWVKLMTKFFNDQAALIGVLKGIEQLALTEEELRGIDLPVCSIVGESDPLKAGVDAMVGQLADHTVTVIPGADHVRAPARPELLDALKEFLLRHAGERGWRPPTSGCPSGEIGDCP